VASVVFAFFWPGSSCAPGSWSLLTIASLYVVRLVERTTYRVPHAVSEVSQRVGRR
jgi:hypothetical protein